MMDDRIGTCPECGGWLIYIQALNEIVCDTCEYKEEGVY
jgi:primosomal protein N'